MICEYTHFKTEKKLYSNLVVKMQCVHAAENILYFIHLFIYLALFRTMVHYNFLVYSELMDAI